MGKKVRWRSPALVAAEILQSGLKQWRFVDDDLLMREDYLEELVFYLKHLDIEFRCSAHVQSVKSRKLELLRDAGCKQIGYGIETGSQQLLDIHKDGCSVELSTRAIKLTKETGLVAQAYMIAGLPGETQETAQETISWLEETQPDKVTMSTCVPYPGSGLYEDPLKYGITWLDPDYSHYMQLGAENQPLTFDTVWADRHELAGIRNTLRKAAGCD